MLIVVIDRWCTDTRRQVLITLLRMFKMLWQIHSRVQDDDERVDDHGVIELF